LVAFAEESRQRGAQGFVGEDQRAIFFCQIVISKIFKFFPVSLVIPVFSGEV
jgi:hypothetical protein